MAEVAILICTVTVHTLSTNGACCKMSDMQRVTHQPSPTIFQPDHSQHMLGVPKARPRFDWFLFAIVVGTFLALVVVAVSDSIFQWSSP